MHPSAPQVGPSSINRKAVIVPMVLVSGPSRQIRIGYLGKLSSTRGNGPGDAAPKLADWAMNHVVVRTDAYGSYHIVTGDIAPRVKGRTVSEPLTPGRLVRHFAGNAVHDRVGVHLIAPDSLTCRLVVVDVDAHGDDDDPEVNWTYAKFVARRAASRGRDPPFRL